MTKDEAMQEFKKKFRCKDKVCIVGHILAEEETPYNYEEFISKIIDEAYQAGVEDTVRELKKWAKGKNVTKEKLRQELNRLKDKQE